MEIRPRTRALGKIGEELFSAVGVGKPPIIATSAHDHDNSMKTKPKLYDDQPLRNCAQARKAIGVSQPYLRAVLKAMGKGGLQFFDAETIGEVKRWIVNHPRFRMKTGLPQEYLPGKETASDLDDSVRKQAEALFKNE